MSSTRSFARRRRMNRKVRRVGGIRRRVRRRPMTSGRVKRIIDAELKFRDLDVGPVDIPSATGSVVLISNIGQGDSAIQRTGNWLKPVSWMGTITIQGNQNNVADLTSLFRVFIVCWKENEDINALDLAKVVQDTASPHQGFNIQNKGQFKILWSRTGIVSNNTDNPQFQKMYRFYVKPSMKILFDDASLRNNHLFIIAYSDQAADPPSLIFSTRLRFTDS